MVHTLRMAEDKVAGKLDTGTLGRLAELVAKAGEFDMAYKHIVNILKRYLYQLTGIEASATRLERALNNG